MVVLMVPGSSRVRVLLAVMPKRVHVLGLGLEAGSFSLLSCPEEFML